MAAVSEGVGKMQINNLIDGEDVTGLTGDVFDLIDPCTGMVYATSPRSGEADVEKAYAAAVAAFPGWKATPPSQRQLALLRIVNALEQREDEFVAAESLITGKPLHGIRDEFATILEQLRYVAGAARTLDGIGSTEYILGHTSYVRREPVGIVGQVAAWNFPLMLAVWKFAPAVAMGNTVVLKPGDTTPLTAVMLAQLASEFLPDGVFNVVCGDRDTGRLVVEHPAAAMVSITGSTRAGLEVAAAAAKTLKHAHLELGGNAPVLVFADADLDAAVRAVADAGYYSAGQNCVAAARILVHEDVSEEFTARLVAKVSTLVLGPPNDTGAFVGPLANLAQLERVQGLFDRLPSTATVATGGHRVGEDGFYWAPTVVSDVEQDDEIVHTETFAPVVTVQRFSSEDEAVTHANDTDYGLTASVWTRDHGTAMRIVNALDFGTVWVNAHDRGVSEMPRGGFKLSGQGKELSSYGIHEYTRIKHIMHNIEI